jgi:hypothetical protein
MKGMEEEKDEEERYRLIIEDCLYWSEMNPLNVYICKLLLDPYGIYGLNYNEGDTLKLDIKKKWGINGFDLVVGNPPYQASQNNTGKKGGGDLLWNKFVVVSLDTLLNKNGYLCFVHPSGWRKPESDHTKYKNMFSLMAHENQMLYLELHDTKDGLSTFKCGTRYDWYLIEKMKSYKETVVKDDESVYNTLDLKQYKWLPNHKIDIVSKLLKLEDQEGVNSYSGCLQCC